MSISPQDIGIRAAVHLLSRVGYGPRPGEARAVLSRGLDRWVREGRYPNRSRALQAAVNLLSEREKRTRLDRELAKLDRKEEQKMAEEGLGDTSWPTF